MTTSASAYRLLSVAIVGVLVLSFGCTNKEKSEKAAPAESKMAPKEEAKQEPVKEGRPAHMPCQIIAAGRYSGKDNINRLYSLYYDKEGRLAVAGKQQEVGGTCETLDSCIFTEEERNIRFQYDNAGRLIQVVQKWNSGDDRLTLNYSLDGRLASYRWVDLLENGQKNKMDFSVKWSGNNDVEVVSGEGHFFAGEMKKSEEATAFTFGGGDGPLKNVPTVWPFALENIFFGQSSSTTVVEVEGLGQADSSYEVRYGSGDEVLSIESGFRGKLSTTYTFLYSCTNERSAEEVL